jgi:hypothetical protein
MKRILGFSVVCLALIRCATGQTAAWAADGYAVVVSHATFSDAQWRPVVAALVTKHDAKVIRYDRAVAESLPGLKRQFPRYICVVARPTEATREFVADVNRLTRQLNDDPYTDAIWGILTGYDAKCALRIATHEEPLVIHRVSAATEVELSLCDEGVWYSELNQGKMVRKDAGKEPREQQGPADSTKALVDTLNDYHPQLFVTSGHASERNWTIGYAYPNGQFRSSAGLLFGVDTQGQRFPVRSDNPKVYLPVGNCLMGHINGPDSMALAFMNSAGVDQMIGYTMPTWYGYSGWGLLDYFVEQPGRYTLAEAFYVNQQALIHRLETYFPGAGIVDADQPPDTITLSIAAVKAHLTRDDARGLLFDRDTVAFYGDPAWSAKMAPGPLAWDQVLHEKAGSYQFEIKPLHGEKTFETINKNGSQRGGRPIVQLLSHRIKASSVKITEGADLQPLVTDGFILIPRPERFDSRRSYRVVFTADRMDSQ